MKKIRGFFVFVLFMSLIGLAGGFFGSIFLEGTNVSLVPILLAIGTLIVSFVLHLVIHEFGHLIFGKLSGYTMVSFRILSFIWVRIDGAIVFKRQHVAMTLGQCLMTPPDRPQTHMPFKLYLAGGGLLNLITSFLLVGLAILFDFRSIHILAFAVAGVLSGLINLIPMLFNDGALLKKCWNNKEAQCFLYKQLKVNALTTNGTMYQELDDAFFELPANIDYQDLFHLWVLLIHYNRAIERYDFNKAKEIIDDLWNHVDKQSFYRPEIAKEWLFCQMYVEVNETEVRTIYVEKSIQASLAPKLMNHQRVKATYEWKIKKNIGEATRLFEDGLHFSKYHANKAEQVGEEALMKRLLAQMKEVKQA